MKNIDTYAEIQSLVKKINSLSSDKIDLLAQAKYELFKKILNSTVYVFRTPIRSKAVTLKHSSDGTLEKGEEETRPAWGFLTIRDHGKKIKAQNLKLAEEAMASSSSDCPDKEIDPKSIRNYRDFIPFCTDSSRAWKFCRNLAVGKQPVRPAAMPAKDFIEANIPSGIPLCLNPGTDASLLIGPRDLFEIMRMINQETPETWGLEQSDLETLSNLGAEDAQRFGPVLAAYQETNPSPRTVSGVAEMASRCLDPHLVFHPDVWTTIEAHPQNQDETVARRVWEMLLAASNTLYHMVFSLHNPSEESFQKITGQILSMVEGNAGPSGFLKSRTCQYLGQDATFFSFIIHPAIDFRIHFHVLEKERKILICHMGLSIPVEDESSL
ncbi:MAG: hypothetical protein LBP92_00020 [Deltaproteobacteria bacterium]|jgi:hypothetical protein|nr:hypothetical protein [Deltaproteobacteria bacterium]